MAFTTDIANILGLNTNVNALNFGALVQKLENNDVFLKTSIEENYDTLANLFNKIGFQSQNAGYGSTAPNLSMFVDDQNKLIYKNNTGTLLDMEASISGEFDTIQVNTINDKDGGGITITSDVIIQGELNVGVWNATTIKDTEITDNIITLNKGEVGPGVTVTGNQSGIEIDRGSGVNKAQLFWDDSIDKWIFGINGSTDTIMGQNDIPITYNGIDAEYNDNGSLILKVQTNEGLEIRDAVENEPIASIFEAQGTPNSEGIFRLYENNQVYVELRGGASQPSYFNGGNVGIGTSSPDQDLFGSAKVLHLSSTDVASLRLESTHGSGADFEIAASNSQRDVYIYNKSNNGDLILGAGNSEKVRIDSSGNVGIGRTPTGKLDVKVVGNNGIRLYNSSDTVRGYWLTDLYDNGIFYLSNSSSGTGVYLSANPSDDNVLNGNLRVSDQMSIGTGFTPTNALNVSDNSTNAAVAITQTNSAGSGLYTVTASSDATDYAILARGNNGSTEVFSAMADGKVGFGTLSPARKVTIYEASSNESFLHFANSTTGATSTDGAHIGLDNNEDLQIALLESGKLIEFYNNGIQAMVIDSSGNVGIGTNLPTNRLDVRTTTSDTNTAVGVFINEYNNVTNGTTSYPLLRLNRIGSDGVSYSNNVDFGVSRYEVSGINSRTRLDISLAHTTSATDVTVMSLLSSGNVGIGTSSPSTAKLWISESDTTYSANSQSPLVVERAGNCFQQFLGGNTSQVGLLFGDNDFDVSWIVYDHNDDSMRFGTDATEKTRITADGHFYHGLQTGFGGTAVFRSNANTQYLAQGATSSEITLVVDNGVQSRTTSPKSGIGFAGDRDGINHSIFAAIIGGKENSTYGNISGRLEFWVTRDLAQSGNNLQNRVWYINSSGHWLTENHNTQDIGTTSTRLRNVYVGTTVSAGSFTAGLDIPQGNGTLLHLHGGITNSYARFTNNTTGFTSTDGLLIGTSGSVSYLYNYEDHELNIRTGPSSPITFDIGFTERMRIDSSGKVGIGTSTPSGDLHIESDSTVTTQLIMKNTATGGKEYHINCTADSASIGGGNFAIRDVTANAYRMTIDSSGNVGIGTSSPSRKLTLNQSDSTASFLQFTNSTTGSTITDGSHVGINNSEDLEIAQLETGKQIQFWNGGDRRLIIHSDGDVGIGTTVSGGRLSIQGQYSNYLVSMYAQGGAQIGGLWQDASGHSELYLKNSSGVSKVLFSTAGSDSYLLDSKFGIGTSSPTEKLEVDGAIKVGNASGTADGTIRWTGTDFEGRKSGTWESLTGEGSFWNQSGSDINYTAGKVGIGTTSPGSFSSAGNNLVVGSGSGDEGLTIYSGSSNGGKIYFADGTSGDQVYRGWVTYEHYTDALQFGTDASTRMVIDSNGILTIKDSTNQAPSISNFEIHDNSRTTMRLYNTKHHGSLVANATIGDYYIDYDVSTSGIIRRTAASWSALYEYVSGTQKNIKVSFFANARDTGAATRIGKFLFQGTEGSTIHDIMTITAESGGRVGIGTSAPDARLHTYGDNNTDITSNRIQNSGGVDLSLIAYQNSHAEIRVGTNHPLLLKTNDNNERMRITADGKVGIGTTSPGAILNIAIPDGSNIGTLYTSKRSYNDSANRVDLVYQYEYNSSGSFTAGSRISFAKEGFTDGHYGSDIRFSTRENGTPPTEKMRILGNGKVGIGTSSPNGYLDVGDQTPSTLASQARTIGVSGGTQGRFYVAGSNQAGMIQEDTGATSNNKVTQLVTYGDTFRIANLTDVYGTKSTSILVDKSTGFVGINKTSASTNLDVNGEILSNSQIRITNTGQARLVADAGAITFANDSSLDTVITTSGLERMRILAGGFVGIGTAGFSPTNKLHVHESTSASCYAHFTNQATGNTASDGLLVGVNGSFGNPLIWSYENVNLWFATNNARRMELRADGALAMCSQNSQVQTGILQTRNTDEFAIRYNSYHDGSNDRIITGGTTAASAMVMDNNGTFRFLNIPQGSLSNGQTFSYTERMRIDSSGNVGIGTSDTTTHLDGVSGLTIYDSYSAGIALANSSRGYLMYTSGGNLSFWDSTANAIRMYLTSSGHFGIGTSNPQRMLHVQRTSSNAFISVTTNTYQIAGILFGDTQSDSRGGIWYYNNTETMVFRTNAGARWSIDSNGHLDPNGGGTYDIGDTNNRVRTIYSNNALNTSDYNLKKDFTVFNSSNQIDQAVNAIMDTDMVLYRFGHEDASKTNQTLGFVLNDTRENGYYTDPFFKARTDDQSYNIMHVVGTLMAANKRAYSIIQQLVKIVKDNNLDTQSLPLDDMIPQD